jgi:hypothetical protein
MKSRTCRHWFRPNGRYHTTAGRFPTRFNEPINKFVKNLGNKKHKSRYQSMGFNLRYLNKTTETLDFQFFGRKELCNQNES